MFIVFRLFIHIFHANFPILLSIKRFRSIPDKKNVSRFLTDLQTQAQMAGKGKLGVRPDYEKHVEEGNISNNPHNGTYPLNIQTNYRE